MSDPQSKPRRAGQPVLLMAAVALALAALLLARSGRPARDTTGQGTPGDPRGVVAALLEAQRDGDADGCRSCLAGAALQEFEARRRTLPRSQFAAELRSGLVDLKGHATTELNQQAPDAATLVLELIFADRNERQQLELRRIDGAWKVTRRAPADRLAPPIPYGTPVVPSLDGVDETSRSWSALAGPCFAQIDNHLHVFRPLAARTRSSRSSSILRRLPRHWVSICAARGGAALTAFPAIGTPVAST